MTWFLKDVKVKMTAAKRDPKEVKWWTCELCGLSIQHKNHKGSQLCRAAKLTRDLYARNMVPYPPDHSVPDFLRHLEEAHETIGGYGIENSDKCQDVTASRGVVQHWYPFWVRAVTESIGSANDQPNSLRRLERDRVLAGAASNPELAAALESSYRLDGREGVRATAAAYLKEVLGVEKSSGFLEALRPGRLGVVDSGRDPSST